MSEGQDDRRFHWTSAFGPASVLAVLQIAVILIGGVYAVATFQATAQNTKDTTDILRGMVNRQEARTGDLSDRLIRVETVVVGQTTTLATINQKIDNLKR